MLTTSTVSVLEMDVWAKYYKEYFFIYLIFICCGGRCAEKIGRGNAQLTMMLAEELLGLHPYLLSTEEDAEDPACILLALTL
jgi:hypothetical protein